MCNFRVGQKVVCVDDAESADCRHSGLAEGEVYTVSVVGHVADHIRVVEATGGYLASRFRPVVERKTDIEIFRRMLNTTPETVGAA